VQIMLTTIHRPDVALLATSMSSGLGDRIRLLTDRAIAAHGHPSRPTLAERL
jgi:hypothetical protein